MVLTKYHFSVNWDGTRIGFTEVSGLESEIQVIEYREGSDYNYHMSKIPGMKKFSNVVLKRGTVPADNEFFEWMNTLKLNKIEKRDITISLLNENHEPMFAWDLVEAFPVKLKVSDFKADGNEVFIEEIELAYDSFVQKSV